MADSPMKCLVRFGHKPHNIDRKKYGQPIVALYWANRTVFSEPGLYLWTGVNRRIVPFKKKT